MKPITILLIDDHPVVRTGYRRLLESTPNMCIVAEADNGETGYQLYQEHQPDVTILDLNMPGIGGLETIRRIRAKNPAARILVFSMLKNATVAQSSLKAGATGFISKQSGMGEMIQAVRQVNSGKIYIESELASALAINATRKETSENPLDTLTKREFQIFKLLAEGHSCAQIAEILTISSKTVGVHQLNLMRKLDLQNTAQLIRLAMNHNVIQA
ncbi:response regulator transcription factor [Nitrosomonas sp. Nm166]|uniref:response regulator n=1 Tax=Nitrosomonas sp. Nm166 TaxID=1881054 RepID=UPI0008E5E58B|nr:response regulator transcription factor [Nitrosomonas sp. Nm166]SFE15736.1 two-component system, NarL family, invasion response regulator UvrY [Nitrosomonas sp. Nm166]